MHKYLYRIVTVVTIILSYSLRFDYSDMIQYLLLVCLIILIFHPEYLIPVYLVSSIAGALFILEDGVTTSRYISVSLIVSLFVKITTTSGRYNREYFNLITVFILIAANMLFSVNSLRGSFNAFFIMAQNILIVWLLFNEKGNYKEIINLLYITSMITLLLIYVEFSSKGFNLSSVIFRTSIDESINTNRFAMIVLQFSMIIISYIFIEPRSRLTNIFTILFSITNFSLILLSGSRSAFIAFTLTLIMVYLLYYNLNSTNAIKNKRRSLVLPFVLLLFIAYYWLQDYIPYINRFSYYGILDSGGASDRFFSTRILIERIIPDNIFLGVGLGNENVEYALNPYGSNLLPSHNMFVDTLAQIGLVGVLIYIISLRYVFKTLVSNIKSHSVFILPFAIICSAFINGLGENTFMEKYLWNGFALVLYLYNNHKSEHGLKSD